MSFQIELRAFRENAEREFVRFRNGVALKLFAAVIRDTPVLTGRLRSAWTCSVGMPSAVASQVVPGRHAGPAVAAMSGVIPGATKATDELWLSNATPYAQRIEFEGWSHTKAPDGMVYRNVRRFRMLLERGVTATTT